MSRASKRSRRNNKSRAFGIHEIRGVSTKIMDSSSSDSPCTIDMNSLLGAIQQSEKNNRRNINQGQSISHPNQMPSDVSQAAFQELLSAFSAMNQLNQYQQQLVQPFPLFPFPLGPMGMQPLGHPGIPTNTLEALALMTSQQMTQVDLRSSSANGSPVPMIQDIRPRAFSSAATLQGVKPHHLEKRRKRARVDNDAPVTKKTSIPRASALLSLLNEQDEEAAERASMPPPTMDEDARLRAEAFIVFAAIGSERSRVPVREEIKEEEMEITQLVPIINADDLPSSVSKDSVFRHHPKFQSRRFHDEIDEIALKVISGVYSPKGSRSPSPKSSDNSSGFDFSDLIAQAISRELVTAE